MGISETKGRAEATAGQANEQAKQAVENPWVAGLMRLGYVVRGLIYVIIGVLALESAVGVGGQTTSSKGGISTIAQTPLGGPFLVLVVVGLAGFALWCFVSAAFDPLHRGSAPKGLVKRLGYVGAGIANLALLVFTVGLLAGKSQGGGGTPSLVSKTFDFPGGRAIVAIGGVVAIGVAIGQFVIAAKASFEKDLERQRMGATERKGAMILGRLGYVARGVIYGLLGWFVLLAALTQDPGQAHGFGDALATLAGKPFGHWLLGALAVGFIALGLYSVACARWIRMTVR
ncbi:MAG: DUF1206 domain-containing protein [Candidatus Dormibacteraeota bacterium]|nr:DUF1206 domain-containing protein [Candidatus Dormibacteraeota bacterium]MDQ6901005.1 DUF1206 domain-containing protein [Candidatus Dormibacteraeota bacterium]